MTVTFADALIALGQHMLRHPDLPQIGILTWRIYRDGYVDGLQVQLPTKTQVAELVEWSRSLDEVISSEAYRYESGSLHVFVDGRLGEVAVRVWAAVPGDGFPDEPGTHSWDVTVQLQEA